MFDIIFWSFGPALLLFSGGMLVRRNWPGPAGRPYFALYLLASSALIITSAAAVSLFTEVLGRHPGYQLLYLTSPAAGLVALLLNRFQDLKTLPHKLQMAALALAAIMILGILSQAASLLFFLIPSVAALALVLRISKPNTRTLALLSLAALAYLILYNTGLGRISAFSIGIESALKFPMIIAPSLVVGMAAALIHRLYGPAPESSDPISGGKHLAYLLLAAALVGYLSHSIYWAAVRDHTSDGLAALFISMPAASTAVAAGLVLALLLQGWRRLGGAAFGLLVPLLLSQAFAQGWDVSYHQITENRAARIEQALEHYHSDHGSYPESLSALRPRYLLGIPEPVILPGVSWCYRSGKDYYSLGTFYREFFSLPISFRLYAQAGSPPGDWACEEQRAYVLDRFTVSPAFQTGAQAQFAVPTAEPLPQSQPRTGRQRLAPLVAARHIRIGSWSPEGRYLFYGLSEGGNPRLNTHLYLYDSHNGEICRTGEVYLKQESLYKQHAWLPGGGLLYIDALGRIYLLEPCQPGHTSLAGLFGDEVVEPESDSELEEYIRTLRTMLAFDPVSGRALIEKNGLFWLLEAEQERAAVLEGISPNPFRFHWDSAAFSPSGERLAIARLNGRESQGGTALFLLNPASQEILRELDLDYATDQSAPWLEWQNENELLLHGDAAFSILDLSRDPPLERRVIEDIFGLQIRYPDEAASMASLQLEDSSYRIAFRANHPSDQAVYIYSSSTGLVRTVYPVEDLLLIFSPQASSQLPHIENAIANRDDHLVFWPDQPEREPLRLEVDGHSPRSVSHLSVRLLPEHGLVAFGSSQGVSLHDLNSGEMVAFFELQGDRGSMSIGLSASLGENILIASAEYGGLYRIPLP